MTALEQDTGAIRAMSLEETAEFLAACVRDRIVKVKLTGAKLMAADHEDVTEAFGNIVAKQITATAATPTATTSTVPTPTSAASLTLTISHVESSQEIISRPRSASNASSTSEPDHHPITAASPSPATPATPVSHAKDYLEPTPPSGTRQRSLSNVSSASDHHPTHTGSGQAASAVPIVGVSMLFLDEFVKAHRETYTPTSLFFLSLE